MRISCDRPIRMIFAAILVGTLASLQSCLAPAGTVVESTSVATVTTGSEASINADLYLKIQWTWENETQAYSEVANCQIASGAAPTTSTCTLSMPEAKLFFGKLKFTWGSNNSNTCKVIVFRPNYFRASNAAGFIPYYAQDQSTTIDCSASPVDEGCYMGAARYMVPGFPNNTSLYFLAEENEEVTSELDSAQNLELISNRLTVDNYATPAVAIPGEYLANSLQKWELECRDEYYELVHEIQLTISDQDGGTEHFSDWP